jgi:hypothetical protein
MQQEHEIEIEIEIEKGMISLINRLEPRSIVPMPPEGDEFRAISFRDAVEKKLPPTTRIFYPAQRGDRFSFDKQK